VEGGEDIVVVSLMEEEIDGWNWLNEWMDIYIYI
jgi:hypothetical protein